MSLVWCVVMPSMLDVILHLSVNFVSRAHAAVVTQEEGQRQDTTVFILSTFLLQCLPLIFIARRIRPSLSLVAFFESRCV